jgi:hypothetical protein
MDKLSNYMIDFDNANLPIKSDEIEFVLTEPYDVNTIKNEIEPIPHNYIYRPRNKKSYIELPSNVKIKKLISTDNTFAFITIDHEFFILYDHIQHFEKIANHIKDCIASKNVYLLITETNKVLFINASSGEIYDDTYWYNEKDSAQLVYTVKDKFIIKTTNKCLYVYDGCTFTNQVFDELNKIVKDVIVTLDTITVLTCDGRVWVYGNKEHGACITNGHGFIQCISNAIQVVRTIRAGAILTQDNNVWSWGDVSYGGSPRPNWIQGISGNCKQLLSTGTSIIAITLCNQLWAWSNKWFKTYDLQESDYAIASCIHQELKMENIERIAKNKTSWFINMKCGTVFYIGNKGIKIFSNLNSYNVHTNGYIWILYKDQTRDAILINDSNFKTFNSVDVYYYTHQILIQELCDTDAYIHYMTISPFGELEENTTLSIEGHIEDILLTKYGTIFTTTKNYIYKDGIKIEHQFENVVRIMNNKKEMVILLQVDKHNNKVKSKQNIIVPILPPSKQPIKQVIKNTINKMNKETKPLKSILRKTPSFGKEELRKTRTPSYNTDDDDEGPLIQIQPRPDTFDSSERYLETEKIDNTKTMFIVIVLLIVVAIIMTFLIFKR